MDNEEKSLFTTINNRYSEATTIKY